MSDLPLPTLLRRNSSEGKLAKPKVVGVMGGSFNPIHLGHVLLAVTVKEAMRVDEVVLVPVFKHPYKTNLLPFEDRVAMCELAMEGKGVKVSTVEQETGESNAAMVKALRTKYPPGTQLKWVCGDDIFRWIDDPEGQEMTKALDGLILQRRLHRSDEHNFYKERMDEARMADVMERSNIKIELLFGELPHFSSTLVRGAGASWNAYLPQSVEAYLSSRPDLLAKLVPSANQGTAAASPEKPLAQGGCDGAEPKSAARPTSHPTRAVLLPWREVVPSACGTAATANLVRHWKNDTEAMSF